MKVIKGDLIKMALRGEFDVIVHGCNCQCVMGGGIARTIRKTFPEAYEADCELGKSASDRLGHLSQATVAVQNAKKLLTIVNAYTQFSFGLGVQVDYDAIRSCFKEIKTKFSGKKIGYPKIGAGLGGGDWERISKIIDEELAGENHTLVEYEA
jgi:O-acetyl-ADP-ribose deacetylase (regulator of RNase III)